MPFRARSAVAQARQINLNQRRLKRETEQAAKLERWCSEHDVDGNGEFDRDELRSLLNALHPEQPVEDSMLDELLQRATGVQVLGRDFGKHAPDSLCSVEARDACVWLSKHSLFVCITL